MKLANSANPTQIEAILVRSNAGLALAAMSTSGEANRRSISTKETSRTAATASSPIVRGAPQPHTAASLSGSSRQNKATASRTAPGTSNRPTAALGRLGEEQPAAEQRHDAAGQADPEQQVVIGMLADQSRQRQAERPADAEHRADQRHAEQRAARRAASR